MIVNVYAYTRSPKIDTLYKINSLDKKIKHILELDVMFVLDFCGIKSVTLKEDLIDVIKYCHCINVKKGMLDGLFLEQDKEEI